MRRLAIIVASVALGCGSRSADHGDDSAVDAAADSLSTRDSAPPDEDGGDDALADGGLDPGAPIEVSLGWVHACALTRDGHVRCWGNGFGLKPAPPVPGLSDVVQIATGHDQTCVRTKIGEVRCWGDARWGLLGDGKLPGPSYVSTPAPIAGLTGIMQVGAGGNTIAVLGDDGAVRTWGWNWFGQLGYPTTTSCGFDGVHVCSAVPTTVLSIGPVKQLALGEGHVCALLQDGTVACWGDGTVNALGDGYLEIRTTPGSVPGLTSVESIVAGFGATCVRLSSGTVKCWGFRNPITPIPLKGTPTQMVIGLKGEVCFLIAGVAQCTDLNYWPPVTPKEGLPKNIVRLGSGPRSTCAITTYGTMYCWGGNPLGDGKWDSSSTTPVKVLW